MNIKTDSRKVTPGDTFVAIKGMSVDGHDYIDKAIENGATTIVAEHVERGKYSIEVIITKDTQKWLEDYLIDKYDYILNNTKFIAVTGTNGKTTTAYLIYQLLNKFENKCAYIGTNGFYIAGKLIRELNNTAPEITEMYSLLIEAYENKCDSIVLEASSHALVQRRIAGIRFNVAGFTNLTQDHLDYHKNMAEYLGAKLMLLDYMRPYGVFVTNIDDPYGNRFQNGNYKTIGFNAQDYKILSYDNLAHTTLINFSYNSKDYEVETNLSSKFNVYNYIQALAMVHELGYPIEAIIKFTKDIFPPKGRCEIIPIGNAKAVVDYAHTPDAVEKIITAFNNIKTGKVITIIGCGGDRDPIKRPIMGRLATNLSDYVIFTNDNPRTEDEKNIMKDIIDGVSKSNYEIEHDRRLAIQKGIDMLKNDDILLILGKGHEDYQIVGSEKHHFDDAEEVKNYIIQNNK